MKFGISENFKWKKLRKELIKRKETLAKAAKEKVKEMVEKHLKKQLDTIVYPPNKPYYCVRVAHGLPLEKLFEWCFLIVF